MVQSTHEVYKMHIGDKEKKQKDPSPYFRLNQSTKSNIDIVWSFIYTLAYFLKVYKKADLIAGLTA